MPHRKGARSGSIVVHGGRLLTLRGPGGPRRGAQLRDLGIIDRGWLLIEHGRISRVESGDAPAEIIEHPAIDVVDAAGCVVMPTFVDCHTHACWAGDRLGEFEQRCHGASYLEILRGGGGILSTVRAVRAATDDELAFGLLRRIAAMMTLGTGTIEVKSGYGLDQDTELRMLRIIHSVSQVAPAIVMGTFLGAHAIDPEDPAFIERTIAETLPAVAQEFPGITCDAYCETGAWSVEDCTRLFEAARDLGCPLRVHADQFNALGMTRVAVEMGAVSVDHLETTPPEQLRQLAESSTFGVMLPVCGFHLDGRYPPGRAFVDMGGALALATNINPGSAPSPSMPFVIALACRRLGLSVAEAITLTTWNPAALLGIESEVGSIEPGKRADLQVLDSRDERELAFEISGPGPAIVILRGEVVTARAVEREVEVEDEDDDDDEDEDEDDDGDEDDDRDNGRGPGSPG